MPKSDLLFYFQKLMAAYTTPANALAVTFLQPRGFSSAYRPNPLARASGHRLRYYEGAQDAQFPHRQMATRADDR
jgi:hypothetical protein